MILNDKCPRSLFFSVEKINYHLNRLKKGYREERVFSNKIEYMFKKLKKLSVNDILDEGLHQFLINFIEDISKVYNDLEKKYFLGT